MIRRSSEGLPFRSAALAFLTAASVQIGIAGTSFADPRPPNFIIVLVDDLGWMDLSCQGSGFYETPHIDRLAAEGIRFTDAYAACAVCSPTRAAVLTGRYPARIGLTDWIRARFQRGAEAGKGSGSSGEGSGKRALACPRSKDRMDLSEVTIAEALKPAGYISCHIGKWHLGDDEWYPDRQGFDINIGGCDYGQPPSYFDPYSTKSLPQGIPTLKPRKAGEYLTDREADEAVRFIRESRDRPFFLHLAHHAVHRPIQAKPELTARYGSKPRTNQKDAAYAAMIESIDEALGRILGALEETGLSERTLLMFTSDNGGLLPVTDNAPLRAGKGFPHEGGIRVPLIARWPGKVPAGSISREPVSSVDLFPTVLEVAGVAAPKDRAIDGVSLLDHLRSGGARRLPRDALFWHFPHYRYEEVRPYGIVRSGDWKLIENYEGPSFELYDLRRDPGEKEDLSKKLPERVEELRARLEAHLRDVGAIVPRPEGK